MPRDWTNIMLSTGHVLTVQGHHQYHMDNMRRHTADWMIRFMTLENEIMHVRNGHILSVTQVNLPTLTTGTTES